MHLKRHKAPKKWPIPRKGSVYIVRPSSNLKKGIPVLIIIRDILKLAQNKKETKKAIYEKNILLNKKPLRDEKYGALLFDVITIVPSGKNYRVEMSENGKFKIEEIKKQDSETKVSKIVGKKILKGKKTQLNLMDGKNFLSNLKCNINDSVVVEFDKEKIGKCISLKENSKAIVFDGKHTGKSGIINKIDNKKKKVEMKINEKVINVLIKQIMVLE
tara:strand:+ start:549 stop:1196 length:648 start_codon:yes stop_codon:yes gene_type:complete